MNVIERLEDLVEASAPRPWTYVEWGSSDDRPASIGYEPRPGHRYAIAMQPRYDGGPFKTHAALICAVRDALPDLLKLARAADVVAAQGLGSRDIDEWMSNVRELRAALVPLFREEGT